ncbi:MAG: excinuclease ABC subunit UvrB [Chlamydiales bacterium]|nr:excinuclease ABC subunit UvrB [Chlamydiales bacterium]
MFKLKTDFSPCGDQPAAIEKLVSGIIEGKPAQVLLGVTGSGKTYTMANIIERTGKPALILAHNKTLAAQLYQEFKNFFPDNAVEYFVSYYDYYQPEAYLPRTDTYIEKDLSINDEIDKMRLSATRSLIEREDVLIVASVSCIYGLGLPEYYAQMNLTFRLGEKRRRDEVLLHLVEMHYKRNDIDFFRGIFRVRGDILEIYPAYEEDLAYRIEFFDDDVERISEIEPLTGKVRKRLESVTLYPGSHHVTPHAVRLRALETIRAELEERIAYLEAEGKVVECERIRQRTLYDLEMIKEVGFCKGIENYSRHFSGRGPGDPPPCLLDYFPEDYLLFVDESHQTIPQLHAMYNGDRARKKALVDFGFRLPSAYDNRPLKFRETLERIHQVVYVSATPGKWEIEEAEGEWVEQIIRPTGLLDPRIEVRPATGQVDDVLEEIRTHTEKGGRVLVTTLTKRLSEDLTSYLLELGVKAKYLHSDIDTLERVQILRDLRIGTFDVLVGINLLREGLDLPEVSLVAILDADKQGFLRSQTALVQTCGRAARNAEGRVIMYADIETEAIRNTIAITEERRARQIAYNKKHGIVPKTIKRDLGVEMGLPKDAWEPKDEPVLTLHEKRHEYLTPKDLEKKIKEYERLMRQAAKEFRFEDAAKYRDLMRKYKNMEMRIG